MGKIGRARMMKTVMMTTKMVRRVRERKMRVGRRRRMMRRKAVEMRRMGLDSLLSMATLLIWKRGTATTRRLEIRKRTMTSKTRRMRRREREGEKSGNLKERRKGGKQRSRKG